MRSALDFNSFYEVADPWGIARASFRDRALLRVIGPHVAGKRVLELGCGEGHLTSTLFGSASSIAAIDISDVAIMRAKARGIRNARFEVADFMSIPFADYDVIAAIECVNYLSLEERAAFFAKVKREHRGILIVTNPIIGGKYFTHAELVETFASNDLHLLEWRNIYPRQTGMARPIDLAIRYSGIAALLDWLPDALVYQRAYIARCS